jgi:hypothetical protein
MISVPDKDDETGPWKERTSQRGIEAGCWKKGTVFSNCKYSSDDSTVAHSQLGFLRVGPGAQAVLDGTDRYATQLLQKLQRLPGTKERPIPIGISTDSYIQGWKHAKE